MTDVQLAHISEEPWSNFSAADYSIEQWHNSCLIHLHDGPPTSKGECKLPVKTPSGALNRRGVFAAAAAIAGARGGVNAPASEKAKAVKRLLGYYQQLGQDPPKVLLQHVDIDDLDDILVHYGVKGMKWGVRRDRERDSVDEEIKDMSNEELRQTVERMRLTQQYRDLRSSDSKTVGRAFVSKYSGQLFNTAFGAVTTAIIGSLVKKHIKNKMK